ncbi:hypothetical protein N0V93_001842 [Gnomoniopsis smithogilvyi]|uniref:Uncharacterized protein n=1 Tax=Gnomoniopsis smithogilvyi TaxID=1191159 RepID=A0A9W9D2K7_9PEZI|nr:hypothetical protein N0V93_001842 [Gnomoniopsis smithogilvyi]
MPNQNCTSATRQNKQQRETTLLRNFMDRESHSFAWPYSCPPFPSAPGWFPVNGMGYQPQFTAGDGIEGMGIGLPVWVQSPDLRSMPAMSHPRQQPASQTQEANGTSPNRSHNNGASAGGAGPPSRNSHPTAENANYNIAIGALVPSRPSSPITVTVAMQCLSGQLHDAIRLCADCLKTHAEFVAKVHFATTETRNGVWKDLLEHKLKNSGFSQHGFNNLGRRLTYYMEQACYASQNDPALESSEQEKQREAKDRVRHLRLLRATCDEVVKLSREVSVDVLDSRRCWG